MYVDESNRSYERLDKLWLHNHLRFNAISIAVIILLEIGIYIANRAMNAFSGISERHYVIRYVALPSLLNLLCLGGQILFYRSKLPQRIKEDAISYGLMFSCFICYSAHQHYAFLVLIFIFPPTLSVVYGHRSHTLKLSLVSFATELIAVFLVYWDHMKTPIYADVDSLIGYLVAVVVQVVCMYALSNIMRFEFERRRILKEGIDSERKLETRLRTDALTGLNNRVALRADFDRMLLDRNENQYVFVMADIDHFKQVNDTLGHPVGDRCLTLLAETMQEVVTGHVCPCDKLGCADCCIENNLNGKPCDCAENRTGSGSCYRYGGDEFCILFRNMTEAQVEIICERIRTRFARRVGNQVNALGATVSFGVEVDDGKQPIGTLVAAADRRLYVAKQSHDKVCCKNDENE